MIGIKMATNLDESKSNTKGKTMSSPYRITHPDIQVKQKTTKELIQELHNRIFYLWITTFIISGITIALSFAVRK
jgi:hypothetical protein